MITRHATNYLSLTKCEYIYIYHPFNVLKKNAISYTGVLICFDLYDLENQQENEEIKYIASVVRALFLSLN